MTWRVPVAQPELGPEETQAVLEVMQSGWITQGEVVRDFEAAFARFCGARFAVATNTGTGALHLALMALGIGPGDEVLTTPLSCIASCNPILFCGARPVFADVEPDTFNLAIGDAAKRITARTRAIVAVHLFGHPFDVEAFRDLAATRGIPLVEDASQATGAEYRGRRVGALATVATHSLYANKIVTSAEGGVATTDDEALARRLASMRSFGQAPGQPFVHPLLGGNYKMSNLHAAIARAQLAKIEGFLARRREHVADLSARLAGLDDVLAARPFERSWARSAAFAYWLLFRSAALRARAEAALHAAGIETRPFFSLISDQPPYRALGYDPAGTPVAADVFARGLYVSCSPSLGKEDKELIATTLERLSERPR